MLAEIECENHHRVVLADLEAGLGTLSRLKEVHVDHLLIIADPTEKSLEVARRAVQMAKERHIGRIWVLANRIRAPENLQPFRQLFADPIIFPIPFDMEIEAADRAGRAPIDHSPNSAAVRAFSTLARHLLQANT